MGLLERVSTLIRANLDELVDKAEDPENVIKQIALDMQNQLMQVKTQVAILAADQRLLQKRQQENESKAADWLQKAEAAVDKKNDELARAALQHHRNYKQVAAGFVEQIKNKQADEEKFKSAIRKLEQKMAEARKKSDILLARQRRVKPTDRTADGHAGTTGGAVDSHDWAKDKVIRKEPVGEVQTETLGKSTGAATEKEEEIEKMLAELKSRVAG